MRQQDFPQALKILVIRHRFVGDTVLLVPFLRVLRAVHPQAQIDVVVARGSGELLEHCPLIDTLHWWPKGYSWRQMATALKPIGYHRAYVLKRSWSTALLALAAGIPKRVGFATEGRDWLLTHRIPYPRTGYEHHEATAFLSVLAAEGIALPADEPRLQLWFTDDEHAWARQAVLEDSSTRGPVYPVAIHAVSSNPAKDWPLAHWAVFLPKLAQAIVERHPDHTPVFHLIGGPSDTAFYQTLQQKLPSDLSARVVDWSGQASLRQAAALLGQCRLLVGVDSGPLHVASAVGTPVLALFGPTSVRRWHPLQAASQVVSWGLPCQPCELAVPCHLQNACLRTLDPDQVLTQCLPLISTL